MNYRELPLFERLEFFPKRTRYCVAPIVFNEGDRFRCQIKRMGVQAELADLVVVERRSTDNSTEESFLRDHGVRARVTTDAAGGATAVRLAVAFAMDEGYDGLVLLDGHGKDGVDALPDYLAKLDEGWDFVQGSRFLPGGHHENTPLLRILGIRGILAPLFWLRTGFWYSDGANGFRAYSRRYLTDPRVEPLRKCFVQYNLQFYLSYRAAKLKLRVVEIPVSRVYPVGDVPTKVKGFGRNFRVFREFLGTILGRFDPPER
jgi:dolichol-phosphate mannosyltransferase